MLYTYYSKQMKHNKLYNYNLILSINFTGLEGNKNQYHGNSKQNQTVQCLKLEKQSVKNKR